MRKKHCVILTVVFTVMISFFYTTLSAGIKAPVLHKDAFNSSKDCGICHEDIYFHWAQSMHARSFSDPVFNLAYLKAYHKTRGEAKNYCLNCHAPTVRVTGDYDLENEVTREGITCDFCHSIASLEEKDGVVDYKLNVSDVKYGSYVGQNSVGHNSKQAEFFTTAVFCAGCHELRGKNGVEILSTYSEWKAGPLSSAGVQCQDCHMKLGEGFVVTPELQESKNLINYHDVKGRHLSQLKKAATVTIGEIEKKGDLFTMLIGVTNANAGHKIPTGDPARALILRVNAIDGKGRVLFTQEEIFKKSLLDEHGNHLVETADIFLYAATVYQDNRISPGETRFSTFSFHAGDSRDITIEAKLYYLYRSEVIEENEMLLEMAGDKRVL